MPKVSQDDTCFLTILLPQENQSFSGTSSRNSKSSPIVMEQVLSAFHALGERFSFEIWSTRRKIEIAVWCKKWHKNLVTHLFETQYPGVSVKERTDRVSLLKTPVISHLTLSSASIFPIRRYSQLSDTIRKVWNESAVNMIATLQKTEEAEIRAIQVVCKPLSFVWRKKGMDTLAINDAISSWFIFRRCWRFKDAFIRMVYENFWLRFFLLLILRRKPGNTMVEANRDTIDHRGHGKESASQAARSKLSQLGFSVTVRLVYDGKKENIVAEMYASFAQFTIAEFNNFQMGKIFRDLKAIRERELVSASTLSLEELSGIVALPIDTNLPELERNSFRILPSLLSENKTGILVGRSLQPEGKTLSLSKLDLRRHIALVGKTGSGKSTFLFHLITGLIKEGIGVAVLDPHGDLLGEILAVSKNHRERIAWIDPSDTHYPIAFNVFQSSLDTSLTVASIVDSFHTLFAESWGPRTEYILTQAVSTLIHFPHASLLGIPKILLDSEYRQKCTAKLIDPMLREFWLTEYKSMPARFRMESIAPILNKINRFLMFPMMRNILGQSQNLIHFRECMDSARILLLNLPKGIMGEENSRLLGNFFLSHLKVAAFSRAELQPKERKRFVLVIDELQHFIGSNGAQIETLLAEGRKYRLSLVLSCQHLSQLGAFSDAMFGNIHTLVSYAVGHEDAERLVQYSPELKTQDLMSLPPYYGYLRTTGKQRPYTISFHNIHHKSPEEKGYKEIIREASRKQYARPRAEVEAEIQKFFNPQFPLP